MICIIAYSVLLIKVLKHLESLFLSIDSGNTPFTLENVKHIKQMALFLIISIIMVNVGGVLSELIINSDLDVGFEMFDLIEILFLYSMSYIFDTDTIFKKTQNL